MLLDLLRETPHDEWCEIPRRMSFMVARKKAGESRAGWLEG